MNADQFWAKVDTSGDCWLWQGTKTTDGYGTAYVRGASSTGAHRIAYELTNGPIPPGLHVCHKCDTRPCVRPDHLFLGTPADNARDMKQKGRSPRPPRGDQHWTRRRGREAETLRTKEIAKERGFNISQLQGIIR